MPKIAYIFTTFPKLSERFFLREVLELQKQGVAMDIYSIFGGSVDSDAGKVTLMRGVDWILLLPELIYWSLHRPEAFALIFRRLSSARYGSWTNLGENVLGAVFAIRFARQFREVDYLIHHATWATAPGMAVYCLKLLTGKAYTIEAHAYDVFRDGGDAFLEMKLRGAMAVRSSTEATAAELKRRISLKSSAGKIPAVFTIRRGVETLPSYQEPAEYFKGSPIRVISVGRLIEKKGYFDQLEIYAHWKEAGVSFRVDIVGAGPLLDQLHRAIRQKNLTEHVSLLGKLAYPEVEALYSRADCFIFTGKVSESGDRDGFPNVLGEAMACSLPIFTTDVSGTTEGIQHSVTGTVIDLKDSAAAAMQILSVMEDREFLSSSTLAAHRWIAEQFNTAFNVRRLQSSLWPGLRVGNAAESPIGSA